MRNERIIATCGCVCELSADYNWVDESICDVEINIVEIICDYHSKPPRSNDIPVSEKEIMGIKPGDIVEINGDTFWICNCRSAPLNSMNRKVCHCCRCSLPVQKIIPVSKEDELRQLVSYAIHHLSSGYTNNINRLDALRHLQRGLLAVDSAILAETKDGL